MVPPVHLGASEGAKGHRILGASATLRDADSRRDVDFVGIHVSNGRIGAGRSIENAIILEIPGVSDP